MPRDARAYLWDAHRAASTIADFTRDKTYEQYTGDLLLRSAVERQLEIIGEALSQLGRIAPELARRVPDLPRIISLRNVLIHGYATVNHELVWKAIQEHVPELLETVEGLLGSEETA